MSVTDITESLSQILSGSVIMIHTGQTSEKTDFFEGTLE